MTRGQRAILAIAHLAAVGLGIALGLWIFSTVAY